MKDEFNCLTPKRCISPVSVADTTAQVGQIIDRQGYQSLTYVIAIGAIADATFTVLLEESDDAALTDATAVADANFFETLKATLA